MPLRLLRMLAGALLALALAACGGGGAGGGAAVGGSSATPPPAPPAQVQSVFPVVSDAEWDETAVRQVLHVFAFGGQASDAQVRAWAAMPPLEAASQLLSMAARDDRLSPPDPDDAGAVHGATLAALSRHWSGSDTTNRMPVAMRPLFRLDNPVQALAPDLLWSYGAVLRGVNPVRSRIAFWETNYHMSIHQLLGMVNDAQTVRYFDDIADAIGRGDSYDDVLGGAAASAAIAMQYGHYKNVYRDGIFSGNEDFGREFHQLFFGILGHYDPDVHEQVSIKNTARALTGIRVPYQLNGHRVAVPLYDPALHDPADLTILDRSISGNNAREKLSRLGGIAGAHPESLDNLPVLIVSGLADDRLDAATVAELRRAWRAMLPRDLLRFLRDYVASPLFLRQRRVKYLTSIERNLTLQNLVTSSNREVYADIHDVRGYQAEGVLPFKPAHNVFGGQTGTEAATSSEVFRVAYNRSVEQWNRLATSSATLPDGPWERDWRRVVPRDDQQRYGVAHVARSLWLRFIADGGANYDVQAQAQLHALLAAGTDFGSVAEDAGLAQPVYSDEVLRASPPLMALIADLGRRELALDASAAGERHVANSNIGQAINFVVATPYAFARQGPLP